jgi:prophage antirepressor-like protein
MFNVTEFSHKKGQKLRTVLDTTGAVWFVGRDIQELLSYQGLLALNSDRKRMVRMNTNGGVQRVVVVDEAGLKSIVANCRKPEADRVYQWITSKVIPAVRKANRPATKPVTASKAAPDYQEVKNAVVAVLEILDMLEYSLAYKRQATRFILQANGVDPALIPDMEEQFTTPEVAQAPEPEVISETAEQVEGLFAEPEPELTSAVLGLKDLQSRITSKALCQYVELGTASALLEEHGVNLSAKIFHDILAAHGYLVAISIPKVPYRVVHLTEKGLRYGVNKAICKSRGVSEPRYFPEKFEELYREVLEAEDCLEEILAGCAAA